MKFVFRFLSSSLGWHSIYVSKVINVSQNKHFFVAAYETVVTDLVDDIIIEYTLQQLFNTEIIKIKPYFGGSNYKRVIEISDESMFFNMCKGIDFQKKYFIEECDYKLLIS